MINQDAFAGKHALITGGMGFIGSNLAIALVNLGARVTILDAMLPGYGANTFNIEPVKDKVTINYADIRDFHALNYLVKGQDYIFHMAGQVDHILSQTDPFPDIDINIKGTAMLMEACKQNNPGAVVVKAGTRGQYGAATKLPVSEEAPSHPRGIYEISLLTAEKIMQVYHDIHGIRSVLLRLTNVYGERSQMQHARYNVVNWFVRLAIDDATIKVFGDGKILRDFLYVEDAIEALLMAAYTEAAYGQVINVGIDKPTDFIELVNTLIGVAGTGRWEFAPFSPERQAQEPGSFYSDITKIKQLVGWSPKTSLEDGLRQTVEFYRQNKSHYW